MTPEEVQQFKEKSASYSSVSHYIRSALAEYSDIGTKRQLELMNDLGLFYRKYQNELSWAGGNLNQSVKRANELAVTGLLAPSYIQEVLLPVILETQETLNRIKKDLDSIMDKLQSGNDGPASYDGEALSPESMELFRDELEIALKRLKIINKEKYTPKKYKK